MLENMIYWMRCLIANKWSEQRKDIHANTERADEGEAGRAHGKQNSSFEHEFSSYGCEFIFFLFSKIMHALWCSNENSGLNNLHKCFNIRTNFDFSSFPNTLCEEKVYHSPSNWRLHQLPKKMLSLSWKPPISYVIRFSSTIRNSLKKQKKDKIKLE